MFVCLANVRIQMGGESLMTRFLVDVLRVAADLRMFAYGIPRATLISDPYLQIAIRVVVETMGHSSMVDVKCSRVFTTKKGLQK